MSSTVITTTTNEAGQQTVELSEVRSFLLDLQQRITAAVAELDGHTFKADHWQKAPGEPLQGDRKSVV